MLSRARSDIYGEQDREDPGKLCFTITISLIKLGDMIRYGPQVGFGADLQVIF